MTTHVKDLVARPTAVAIVATVAILAAVAIANRGPALARPAEPRQTDAREALRRARLEEGLIRAEKTVVLLGELVASERGVGP